MPSQFGSRFEGSWPSTVNEKLLHYQLVHAHYLERFSEAEVQRIENFLRKELLPDVYGRLVAKLERISSRGYDTSISETKRWQDLHETLTSIVDDGVREIEKSNTAELRGLSKYEANWQRAALERAIPSEVGINFVAPSPQTLRALVTDRPIAGFGVGEWWDRLTVDTTNRIEREVRVGLAEGQSIPDIARRIRGSADLAGSDGVFAITTRHAKAIARNASVHVSNQARQEVLKKNRDVVESEQWVATLDLRTCPTCGSRDGKTWPVGKGPMPPAHPPGPSGGACRCARVPVVKSLNDIMRDAGSRKRFKGWRDETRASMNGEVAGATTYSEWLSESVSSEELVEALGSTRARAFASGELTLDRMVDQSGRALTLEQIAKREGIDL